MTANQKKMVRNALFQILCLAIGFLTIMPILYALSISFMDQREILDKGWHLLPNKIQWDNYKEAADPFIQVYVEFTGIGRRIEYGQGNRCQPCSILLCIFSIQRKKHIIYAFHGNYDDSGRCCFDHEL